MHSLIQIVMDELFGVNILTGSLSYKSYKQLGSLNAWRMAFHPNDPIGDKGWPLRGLGYGCTYATTPYHPISSQHHPSPTMITTEHSHWILLSSKVRQGKG